MLIEPLTVAASAFGSASFMNVSVAETELTITCSGRYLSAFIVA